MILRLNEEQFARLFEDNGDSLFLDGDDTTKKFSSEVSTQSMVRTPDGDDEMSSAPDTDKISGQLTPQNYGISHGLGRRYSSAI